MTGTDAAGRTRPAWGRPRVSAVAMEHMLYAVYVTLGIFLIGLARERERALPLINWVIVANLVHATVMLVHALGMPHGTPTCCLPVTCGEPTAVRCCCWHATRVCTGTARERRDAGAIASRPSRPAREARRWPDDRAEPR